MKRTFCTTSLATGLLLAGLPAFAQDGVATATANIAAYSGLPTFVAPGDAYDARACMAEKSIFTIPASSAIPFITTIANHKDALAEMLGFEHMVWENQGNPTQWIQGIEHAVNNGYNLVSLLAGADPRFFQPQVAAAQAAGVKVVTSHLTGLEQEAPAGVDGATAIDYR
jgi:ribose transport system substrate-binding protein